jgi:uncharacterized protein (DUF58 family)
VSHVSRYLEPAVVEQLNHLQLSARSVVVGSTVGQHKSPIKGASVEFRQHRIYVHGDEPRRLDWRVLGRTDRHYVKEYDEETNLRCVVMLDCSGSMAYAGSGQSKFDYAAKLAAGFAYLMLGQTESVGVAMCGKGVEHWLSPHGGPMQLARVLDALERRGPRGESGLAVAMHGVAERLERRGLVIVLSDFFVPVEMVRGGLAHLRHDRHEVIAMQVVDRDEEEFPFRNWCRFRGLEGERAKLCEPAMMRKMYRENFRRHRMELREACVTLGVEYAGFITDRGLLEAIRGFLSRRAK